MELEQSLAQLFPTLAMAGIASWVSPSVCLAFIWLLLFQLSPFWWSPGMSMLHSLYSRTSLDSFRHFLFEPNQKFWVALRLRLKNIDTRFLRVHATHTVVWLMLALLSALLPFEASSSELLDSYLKAGGAHFTALALLTSFVFVALLVFVAAGWLAFRALSDWWEKSQKALVAPKAVELTAENVIACVDQSMLFRTLAVEDRMAIAQALQPVEYQPQSFILREGDLGDSLYVTFSGTVEVLRSLPSGRPDPVAVLPAGEVFGEIALLQAEGRRTRSVRALDKCILLRLSKVDFQQLVLAKVSRYSVETLIQKVAFLHRTPLAQNWSPHAMLAFARRASFAEFEEGVYLLREGEVDALMFRRPPGSLPIRTLLPYTTLFRAGDFFGEISLLQNSVASATILARTQARCLVMQKREFLQFLSHDFLIGLHFEEISSQRLGTPIFPLKGKSFDVIRG